MLSRCMQGLSPPEKLTDIRQAFHTPRLCLAMIEIMTTLDLSAVAEWFRATSVSGAGSVCV